MAHGFQYLVAIIDVGSRKTLSWRVSNTMTPDFCLEALQEALEKYGKPEIFNTDQGSQFTSGEWIDTLKSAGARISMDGKGRWIDNVFIERLWKSVKYENIYLRLTRTEHNCDEAWQTILTFTTPRELTRHWTIKPRMRFTTAVHSASWLHELDQPHPD